MAAAAQIRSIPSEVEELIKYYTDSQIEKHRLLQGIGRLECARTVEVISRCIRQIQAETGEETLFVLDVGAGPGVYSILLTKQGHKVHLVDAVPLHVEEARIKANNEDAKLASASVADARDLSNIFAQDGVADLVLLLGPMYHLTERPDRIEALKEAKRLLKPKTGKLIAAAISRYASLTDGLQTGNIFSDEQFQEIVSQDLIDGQHRNPTDKLDYFTSVFFHTPDILREEVKEAGLHLESITGLEGPVCLLHNFDELWEDSSKRKVIMDYLEKIESDECMLGVSQHILAIASKE